MDSLDNSYPNVYLYRRIVQSKLFIDARFSEKLDLNNIADEAFFSKFHFTRLFKKIYGQSPHQYLTQVRIEKAKQMLSEGVPVTEVCFAVGFESLSSFTGLFKRWTRISPSIFQALQIRQHLEKQRTPLKFIPHCFAVAKGWTEVNS